MNIDDIDKSICSTKCALLECAINSDSAHIFRGEVTHFAVASDIVLRA